GSRVRRLSRPRFHVLPALAAEGRETGLVPLGADVPADAGKLVGRREDTVAAAVLELEVVARDPGERSGVEAREAGDAVVLVDDEVTDPQLDRRGEPRPCRDRGGSGTPAMDQAALRDHRQAQLRSQETVPQPSLGEA